MSTGFNTDLQSILNKAMGQLESIGGSNGSVRASSGNSNFVNSVWGLAQEGQAAIEGNDQQRAQAITNIVNNLLGMLTSLGTNENSKATKEVKQNSNNITEVDRKADKAAQTTQQQIEEIVANIANNTSDINNALTTIQKLGGDNGQVAEAQAQLEEQLQIIEEKKQILNDGVSSPEAKEEALQALLVAASVINGLVETISGIQQELEAQNAVVENATDNVSGLIEDSASVITNGAQTLQSFIKEGTSQTVVNTTSAATGSANEIVGAKATAMGSTSSVIPVFGSTAGSKLIQIGADQTSAGGTRIKGSAANLSTLTKAIGEMGSNLSNLSNFTNSVGEVGNNVVALVGQYGETLNPIITATGSWAAVAEVNAQFEQAIADYQSQSGLQVETPWNMEQSNNDSIPVWGAQSNTTEENVPAKEDGKFEFDTNLFRQAFKMQKA